jgi:hypothetical protein
MLMALALTTVSGAASGTSGTSLFADGFESGIGQWIPFEHIIDDVCYGSGLGTLQFEQTISRRGGSPNGSLRVEANTAGASVSNHMLAITPIDTGPTTGGVVSVLTLVNLPAASVVEWGVEVVARG